jgi:dethiobiotin synthetase
MHSDEASPSITMSDSSKYSTITTRTPLIVITGTDTGIGKTTVTRGLTRALVRRGEDVLPIKWVETGCRRLANGQLEPSDGTALARAAKRMEDLTVISPLRFELPAAPTVAAKYEGTRIHPQMLVEMRDRARSLARWVLLEGAGGALVPITEDALFVDLCTRGVDHSAFVLVTRDGLGTIHQTLASYEALLRRDCRVLAVVVNQRNEIEANDRSDSIAQLRRWLGDELLLGPIPPMRTDDDDMLADATEQIGLVDRVLASACEAQAMLDDPP